MVGIKGYGVYIPSFRMKVDEIVDTWKNSNLMFLQYVLKLNERAVCDFDEDVITMAVEASKNAMCSAGVSPGEIGAVLFGSQTSPYVMKPAASVILDALGLPNDTVTGDVQFSSKSGTVAIHLCSALSQQSGKYALAVGSDNISIHTEPGDTFEYPASAGAAAFLIGTDQLIAEFEGFSTYNSDTSDKFRLEGDRYFSTGGDAMLQTDVGQPSHSAEAARQLMEKLGRGPKDFDYVVFHQTYASTSFGLGKALGFEEAQIAPGVFAENLGDTGSASSLIGLAGILDQAAPGRRILLVSYGAGAGSDAIAIRVTENIAGVRGKAPAVLQQLEAKTYINYPTYIKLDRKYHRKEV